MLLPNSASLGQRLYCGSTTDQPLTMYCPNSHAYYGPKPASWLEIPKTSLCRGESLRLTITVV